jgi:hypothetical protein
MRLPTKYEYAYLKSHSQVVLYFTHVWSAIVTQWQPCLAHLEISLIDSIVKICVIIAGSYMGEIRGFPRERYITYYPDYSGMLNSTEVI